jgi:type II secretory pathway pseudopilin PulG
MKNHRNGYLLVEMIVVISVGSALACLAVTLLGSLLHVSGALDDQVHRIATVRRLAEQFREDANAATSVKAIQDASSDRKLTSTGQRFELAPGHEVTYMFQPGVIKRVEQIDEAVRSRESFILPPGLMASATTSSIAFAPAVLTASAETKVNERVATLVALILSPDPHATDSINGNSGIACRAADAAVRIEAIVAKDHRFTNPE